MAKKAPQDDDQQDDLLVQEDTITLDDAAEKLADRLILTSQIQAGWYRYVVSWTFFLDGTFLPGIPFTAVANVCTPLPHYHDVYWRLDFDLDGSENDAIEELKALAEKSARA